VARLPIVEFLGPDWFRRAPDSSAPFYRLSPREVSQEWVDEWRTALPLSHWKLSGDEGLSSDAGNDGLPDVQWRRADITAWLNERDVDMGLGYKTKSALLGMVEEYLNPPAPEPETTEPEPEPEAEEETE